MEPVLRALSRSHEAILVHTGQHYDPTMSAMILRSLKLRRPHATLGVGSGSHATQTARIVERLEPILARRRPHAVLVFGDTNSTLAGALTASKMEIPVAHVEAGLRSYNRAMPEELNRIVVDHLSDLLFCPTAAAVSNLRREGLRKGVHRVGDVMLDSARAWGSAVRRRHVARALGLRKGRYLLLTLHRPGNVDDPATLSRILRAVGRLGETVLFPVHPRTRTRLRRARLGSTASALRMVEPLNYLDFLSALMDSSKVLTDSGGVQKQAYFFGVPCITLREETEWVETVRSGWNTLVGTRPGAIARAVREVSPAGRRPQFYGDGHAAENILKALEARL